MGRTPKPAGLKLLNGRSEGRDSGGRAVPLPPTFSRIAPDAPEWLTPEARAEWDRVVPELMRLELTKEVDRASLAAYCECWARFVSANMQMKIDGLFSIGSQGQPVKNPALAVAEAASKELRAWANEFGLTPVAEMKLATTKADDGDEENPFAEPA